jgi:hypothetical protein
MEFKKYVASSLLFLCLTQCGVKGAPTPPLAAEAQEAEMRERAARAKAARKQLMINASPSPMPTGQSPSKETGQ